MRKASVVIVQLFAVCLVLICASATGPTYAFSARVDPSISGLIPNQTIVFRDVKTNAGNAYNRFTGVYRCPVSGLYQFMVTILSRAGSVIVTALVAGGEVEMHTYSGGSGSRSDSGSNTILLYLNAGDCVYVRARSGTFVRRGTFSGLLIQGI